MDIDSNPSSETRGGAAHPSTQRIVAPAKAKGRAGKRPAHGSQPGPATTADLIRAFQKAAEMPAPLYRFVPHIISAPQQQGQLRAMDVLTLALPSLDLTHGPTIVRASFCRAAADAVFKHAPHTRVPAYTHHTRITPNACTNMPAVFKIAVGVLPVRYLRSLPALPPPSISHTPPPCLLAFPKLTPPPPPPRARTPSRPPPLPHRTPPPRSWWQALALAAGGAAGRALEPPAQRCASC